MISLPRSYESSIRQLFRTIIISVLIIAVLLIIYISYINTDTYILYQYNLQVNGSEEFLDSSAIYINRGLKLWDSTYDQTIEQIAKKTADAYRNNGNNVYLVNLSQIAGEVEPPYKGRVRIDFINEKGVIEQTHGGEIGFDFSQWDVFYRDLTNIRNGDIFVPDRVVNGFNSTAPLTKYGYLPTGDHAYVIEIALDVRSDQVYERDNLSYNSLIQKVCDQNIDLVAISIFNSMNDRIIQYNPENEFIHYSWAYDAVKTVYATQNPQEFRDIQNNSLIRYRYIRVGEDESPSSKYMDLVAEYIYSTKRMDFQRQANIVLHLIVAVFGVAFVLLVGYQVSKKLTQPIQRMIEDIDLITVGDLTHRIASSPHQEINKIAEAINQMVRQIHESLHTIQDSESRYLSLFQSSSDAILLFSGHHLLNINQAGEKIFNITAPDAVNIDIRTLFGDLSDSMSEMIDVSLETTHQGYIEKTVPYYRDENEQVLNLRLTKIPSRDSHLSLFHIRDITEQHRTYLALADYNALRASHAQIEMILQLLPDPSFIIDKDGVILFWNQAMERMTGKRSEEMIGKGDYAYSLELYGRIRPVLIDMALHEDLDSQGLYPNIERYGEVLMTSSWLEKAGSRRYISVIAARLYDQNGEVFGAIESIRDITSFKVTEEALLIANKKLNLLSSITRHDIMNKIMLIKMNLFLIEESDMNDIQSATVPVIRRSLDAIEHFIAFTSTYQELGLRYPEWIDLKESFRLAEKEVDTGDVEILIDIQNIAIYVDPLFKTVCFNLIENAIRHGDHTSCIHITAHETAEGLRISVMDDGTGIPDDQKELIFERGYGKNTGYGLFLSREILSLSGITIIEQGQPGMGCRFEIDVPKGKYRIHSD